MKSEHTFGDGFMRICENLSLLDKLEILTDAAKYDVACTSSGSERNNNGSGIGNAIKCGICHSFAADGRCISLLKILLTNECIFDCRYCINRASNDVVRTSFTPEEVCTLTIEFYRRNYIEGLFLSSGIVKSPTHTMALLYETVKLLREKYSFGGYIHVKGIPGADAGLIERVGWYADRMSVNLELPTTEGLKKLAPNKSRNIILGPMKQIQKGITSNRLTIYDGGRKSEDRRDTGIVQTGRNNIDIYRQQQRRYVPAGQSTQMIVGASGESDYQIVRVSEALYANYDLKRVFYSAFVNVNKDEALPGIDGSTPLSREHRLYQADWLLRFYGFKADELLSEEKPNFNMLVDPKCDWALRHLECFPVEINKADYYTLLRVPGIGTNSARRIVRARKSAVLDFENIKKMGVVLKRAVYFITCSGKMLYNSIRIDEDYIVRNLVDPDKSLRGIIGQELGYRQLSFFDNDGHLDVASDISRSNSAYGLISGQI